MEANSQPLQCGHEVPIFGQTVSVAGVGRLCRACYTPVPLDAWDETLRERTYRHPEGRVRHYTRLLGLDPVGRALYYDTRRAQVLLVVAKHHPGFEQDVTGAEPLLRHYPGRHQYRAPTPVNGPDNSVIVAVGAHDVGISRLIPGSVARWVVEHAPIEDWQAIHPTVLEEIEETVDHFDRDRVVDAAFPVERAEEVLDAYRR